MTESAKDRAAPVARRTANKPDVAVPSTAIDPAMAGFMYEQYEAEINDLNERILDAVNAVADYRCSHWLRHAPEKARAFGSCDAENAVREILAVTVEAAVAKVAGFESWPAFEVQRANERLENASEY